jgi:glycosyltransferase involved in cell wall biosynthesis
MVAMLPLVSVVITTRNERDVIADILRSIERQTYGRIETIVVDNNSSDETKGIARRFTPKVYNHGPERSAQRNFGIQQSNGSYVLMLDADMQLPPSLVEECVGLVQENPAIKALTIPEISFGRGYWSACKALERSCYLGDATIEGVRFIERSAALDCGGYDVRLVGGEDWDFAQRLRGKYPTGRTRTAILHNERTMSLIRTLKKKYYYASTYTHYIQNNGRLALKQANMVFRPAYFRAWRHLVCHPALLPGMLYMRVLEMAAACAGFLVGTASR